MRRFPKVLRRACAVAALAVMVHVPLGHASGVPVIDAAAITQAVKSFTETVKLVREAEKQVSELQEQVLQLDKLIADLTGTRGMSDLLNGGAETAKRRYADTGLGSFIDLAAGTGGLSASASGLETRAASIIGDYGFRPGAQMVPSAPTGSRARSIDLTQGTTVAAMKRAELIGKCDAPALLEATLRMRPDRIILGEIRGVEAFTFLEAINTGHPGSFSSIHADSPDAAFERLALMVLRATQAMSKDQIIDYARSIIDIVIQIGRDPSGERRITEIAFGDRA